MHNNGFEFLNKGMGSQGIDPSLSIAHRLTYVGFYLLSISFGRNSSARFLDMPYYNFNEWHSIPDGLYVSRSLLDSPMEAVIRNGLKAKIRLLTYVQVENQSRYCPYGIDIEFLSFDEENTKSIDSEIHFVEQTPTGNKKHLILDASIRGIRTTDCTLSTLPSLCSSVR